MPALLYANVLNISLTGTVIISYYGVRFGVRFEKSEKSMYPSVCKGFTLYPLEFQLFHGEMRRNGEKQGEVFNGFDSHRLHHSKP